MQARRSTLSVALTVVVLTLGAGSSTAGGRDDPCCPQAAPTAVQPVPGHPPQLQLNAARGDTPGCGSESPDADWHNHAG